MHDIVGTTTLTCCFSIRRSNMPCVTVSEENLEESISKYSTEIVTRGFFIFSWHIRKIILDK